ncbi:MAG: thioredoxin domain-containing protein [Rhodothermaceae bacterium]|nr:thioredoxin domain-containing protein [Rhodothermaceae bacterium]
MNKKIIVLVAIGILVLAFLLGAYYIKSVQIGEISRLANENNELFVRDYAVTMGSEDAKVTLVEFYDPACEACKDFYPFVKNMLAQYPTQLKLVLRYAPFHQGSDYYVKILEASRKQGMYWETLEILYLSQDYWASHHQAKPDLAWEVLKNTNLDLVQLREDMNDPQIAEVLRQDLADLAALNVQKTPGFYVNGKPLLDFGYLELKNLIESEIRANY